MKRDRGPLLSGSWKGDTEEMTSGPCVEGGDASGGHGGLRNGCHYRMTRICTHQVWRAVVGCYFSLFLLL